MTSESYVVSGTWGRCEITISAPDRFFTPQQWTPELRRRLQRVSGSAVERLIRNARRSFQSDRFTEIPMQTSFRRLEDTAGGRLTVGLTNDDSLIDAVDAGSGAHWSPIRRNGVEGTGLEGWAIAHDLNPYAVRAAIAQNGTRGKNALLPLFEEEIPRLARALNAVYQEMLQ